MNRAYQYIIGCAEFIIMVSQKYTIKEKANFIITQMDSYKRYVQMRLEALENKVKDLEQENTDLKKIILKQKLNESN